MISSQSNEANRAYRAYQDTGMPAPEIPTRRTPWFMKALWALALLLVVGLVYSFWRISSVPTPRLDIPQTRGTDTGEGSR
ncbi:MAG TPA: hypothetical protein VFK05_24975 [Polyangiaceae bacterium]|nr:hypothetical protein [Polyangiaceae bacterium]